MADQQQLIDELIDYIDKAVLKNSVSNRHVAEVLDWLNEGLKKIKLEELINIFLRKDQDDTAEGTITFLKGILIGKKGHGITISESNVVTAILDELKNVFSIVSPDFVSGDLGNGFILKYDPKTGRSYLEVDELLVRKLAYFVELIIKRLSHVGGEIILTPASLKCSKVEVYDTYYRCYFEQDDGDKSIVQEFKAGDQARCQTFNVQEGTSHNVSNTYYWRLVTATGKNYIDLSIDDCDLGSMEPSAGDHIVQLGNRTDTTRQNAIILSTVGDDAPSIKQYKGINGYTLRNKEVTILSPTLNKFLGQFISEATGKSYDDMFSDLKADFDIVKDQVDREFTIWFFEYAPTLSNIPAVEWTTDALKALHEQDIFYNRASGLAYRFEKNANGAYSWNSITDQQTVKALEDAAKAQDTADGKRRVFVAQPTNAQAYDIGDLWVNATYSGGGVTYKNDSLVCIAAKTEGAAFSISHWKPSSAATTAYLENLGDRILAAVTDSAEGIEAAKKLANQGINDAYDAYRQAVASGDAASKAQKDADALGDTVSKHATAIQQTKESISALAGKITFDANGKVTNINTSGLVTTSDFNTLLSKKVTFDTNGKVTNISTSGLVTTSEFAGLFASQTEKDGLVKRADISTFITSDQAGNLISNATIQADRINFTGKTIINDNFVVGTDGAMTVRNMTVTDGSHIGAFTIIGTELKATSGSKSLGLSPTMMQFNDSSAGSVKIGTVNYESTSYSLIDINIGLRGAAGLHINALSGQAIIAKGECVFDSIRLKGLTFNVRTVNSGGWLNGDDDYIEFANTTAIEVRMPVAYKGKILYIKKVTSGKNVVLKGDFRRPNSSGTFTDKTIDTEVSFMYIYNGSYWTEFFCG